MKRISIGVVISALASGAAQSAPSTVFDPAAGPTIHIEDVDRF